MRGDVMSLKKRIKIGNTNIEIIDNCIPKDINKIKDNIINLYDVINDVARNHISDNITDLNIFYSNKELVKGKVKFL